MSLKEINNGLNSIDKMKSFSEVSNETYKNSKIKIQDENSLGNTKNFYDSYNKNSIKGTSMNNFPSNSKELEYDYENQILKTNYFQDVELNKLDSKIMLEPIIIKDYFIQNIQKELKKNKSADLLDLKLLEYNILKEIIESCGSFPEKHRINFWKFLFSLPNDNFFFDLINKRGIHPFFHDLEVNFEIKDKFILNKLKNICSNISFWSEEVGNIFFLPNIVYPFIKSFKGNDLFIFETVINLINCFCQFWFEFYPGAPLNHLKLCEKIIEKENNVLYNFFKKNKNVNYENFSKEKNEENKKITNSKNIKLKDPINLKITEISWKFMQSFYSESLDKTSWLQLIDYLSCNSHRPEILLYFNCALILVSDKLIMKCRSIEELYNLLFSANLLKYPISTKNMLKVFKLTDNLYIKYSQYQLYKYIPHIPFEKSDYKMKIKFPLDFLGTTASIKEQLFNEQIGLKNKKGQIDELEKNFKELLKREENIQKTYECMIHKEKEKADLIKRELDLILYQKDKINNDLKERKLYKVGKLQKVIDQSLNLYDKMNKNEMEYFKEEIKTRKILEEYDIKNRLQNEELNNLEFEANKKMIDLLNLRSKDELMQKQKSEELIREKERNLMTRLLEEKWKIEDETNKRNIDNIRNLKEMNYLQLRDKNLLLEQDYKNKVNDFDNKLYIQQVEKERNNRIGDYNLLGRTSIEENFLNSIANVSNKNINSMNKNNSIQIDNELNTLIKELRKNMLSIEAEENALVVYEQEIVKKLFETKLLGFKNFNNDKNYENYIIEELTRLEREKENCKSKKNEIENRKIKISENLNNLYNFHSQSKYSQNNNSNNSLYLKSYKQNESFNPNIVNTYNSMSSSDLKRLEKENIIREENEKLYKQITNSNNTSKNYGDNKNSNNFDNKNLVSDAPTSKFPNENSFGNRSLNEINDSTNMKKKNLDILNNMEGFNTKNNFKGKFFLILR